MSQPDCLFCTDTEPCAVHMPKVKKAPVRKAPSKPKAQPSTSTELPRSTVADPFTVERRSKFAAAAKEAEATPLTPDELILREAIRNLWPILSPSEQKKRSELVSPPRTSSMSKRRVEIMRSLNAYE